MKVVAYKEYFIFVFVNYPKMLQVLLFTGYFMISVSAEGGVDVVLSCTLVEEARGLGEMRGGALERTPATLVLRGAAVAPDQLLETLPPFIAPTDPDPEAILIEAKVSSPQIPDGDLLLHADCDEKEVACEISSYSPQLYGIPSESSPDHFIVSLQIKGGGLSMSLMLQTLGVEGSTLTQGRLGLPLSQTGSLLTQVVFLVFSKEPSVSAPLNGDTLLNCGFRQQETSLAEEVSVEWRVQHHGEGRKVLNMRTGLRDMEERVDAVQVDREGSSVDVALLVEEGNASVTLRKLKVSDEGSYICTVDVGLFNIQQVIQLSVSQPPRVSLSEEKLVFQTEMPQKLTCHCKKYFPLDAKMEWLSLSPADTESTVLQHHNSLSSHRQHRDGTFSLSSHLNLVPFSFSPGTTIICRVSHLAMPSPVSVSLVVEKPEPDSYWMVVGFLMTTVVFFYQVMR